MPATLRHLARHPLSPGLLLLALLSGCGAGTDEIDTWIAEVRARPPSAIDPLPPLRIPDTAHFDAQLPDPFVPKTPIAAQDPTRNPNGLHPDLERPREPLEKYALDSLRMVGSILHDGTLWALIHAQDGTLHRVRKGQHLGKNYGLIHTVTEKRIELVEILPDGTDAWREQNAHLTLTDHAPKDTAP